MAKIVRSDADLTILDAQHRSFEWFWAANGTMPALDVYEALSPISQDDFLAGLKHWGGLAPGVHPAQSRVNKERDVPLILAVKAGKHRFNAFREESGPTWIVCNHYLKEGQQRDKTGDRAVTQAVKFRDVYYELVKGRAYYERS